MVAPWSSDERERNRTRLHRFVRCHAIRDDVHDGSGLSVAVDFSANAARRGTAAKSNAHKR